MDVRLGATKNKAHAKGKKVKFRNWNLETGRYVRRTRGRGVCRQR